MEKSKNIPPDFSTMIINYLTGSISDEQLEIFIKWINKSAKNREIFEEHRRAWIIGGLNYETNTDQAFERLLLKRNTTNPTLTENISRPVARLLKIAATWLIFLIIGSGISIMFLRKSGYHYRNAVKISVPLGSKSCITLPDGTVAWLNAGTDLTYNEDYGKMRRTLLLTGEAFFEVAEDKEHPFIVLASDVTVQAIGTKFNIKAYPEEKVVTTTLVEGKIDVRIFKSKRQLKKVILMPNEEIIYYEPGYRQKIETSPDIGKHTPPEIISRIKTKEVQVISNVDARSSTSWKDERWIIGRQPLGYLVPLLERRYNLKILFDDEELKQYNFTGIIQNETAEQIMHALSLTAPLTYHISNDTIVLRLNAQDKEHFNKMFQPKN